MSEGNITHWEISQLAKTRLFPDEQAVLRSALRALFQSRPEIRRQMVIRLLPKTAFSLEQSSQAICSVTGKSNFQSRSAA